MVKQLQLSPRAAALRAALFATIVPRLSEDERPKFAADSLTPVLMALRRGTSLSSTRKAVLKALGEVTKGKLAQDADIDDIAHLLDAIENVVDQPAASIPEGMEDNSLDDTLEMAPETAPVEEPVRDDAGDPMIAKIREFLKGVGVSDEILAQFDTLVAGEGEPEEVSTELPTEEDDMSKDSKLGLGGAGGMRQPPPRHGMDQAAVKRQIDAAVDAATLRERQNQRAIHAARTEVRPVVGELALAFDSAEDVYGAALKALGHADKLKGTDPSAYKHLFALARDAKAAAPRRRQASDALPEGIKSLTEMFPGAARVSHG